MERDQDENAPANICSLRTFYKVSNFFRHHSGQKAKAEPLFAETSESWLDWSAILASVDWCACAKPSKPTCKKRICCRLALKNAFTQTHVAFCNETDLLQAVRWGLRKSCLKMSRVSERHRILPLKQTWEPTGRMPNKAWPARAGSGEIPLYMKASSNTSSPYVSQLIPSIQKYIGHIVQTTHACRRKCFL